MLRWISILLLGLVILPDYGWSQEKSTDRVAICLRDLDTPPDTDLTHIVKAIRTAIMNRLYEFPSIVVYPGESAPGKYFKEPDEILKADKVQLLQIRRETGFDGLIFGKLADKAGVISLTLHLVDFSSGRIHFSGEFQDGFGSALLNKVEEKIALYADALISYYNCALAVTSEPSSAEVWANGERAGVTPIGKLDVKDGLTKIQVKMPGYVSYETEIELQAGQRGVIHAQLYKYSLTATSQPPGADVHLDDQFVGVTPIKNLAIEKQKFTVKFTKKGFAPYSEFISLSPGEQAHIHAELYDLLVDHLRSKKSPWEIDSHNFGFVQSLESPFSKGGTKGGLEKIEIDSFPSSSLRYYAKFGRFSAGFGMSVGTMHASQHFDTFLKPGEGYEPITIDVVKGTAFSHYNIIDKLDRLELYLGANVGFLSAASGQSNAPPDLRELQRVSPVVGGEIGVGFYIARMFKLSAVTGGYYAGKLEYAAKEASYWGQAKYKQETVKLHPFYVGLALTFSLWPALM